MPFFSAAPMLEQASVAAFFGIAGTSNDEAALF